MAKGKTSRRRLIEALELRYDHSSAHTVFDALLKAAHLPYQEAYSPEDVSRLTWALNGLTDDARPAVFRMLELAGEAATAAVPEEETDDDRLRWN